MTYRKINVSYYLTGGETMKNIRLFIITPTVLFLFLIMITDLGNAIGGIFIYLLVMFSRFLFDRFKQRKENHNRGSGN